MNQKSINLQYEILLQLIKQSQHGRNVAKQISASLTTIQRILKDLMNLNILDYKQQGKNKIFFIKDNLVAKRYVYNAENYKFLQLIEKYPILQSIIIRILGQSNSSLIILFGSYAKFNANKSSDLDIYISSKENLDNIYSKLSIKSGKFNTKDLLIKEIINNHIIIRGVEEFYEKTEFFNEVEEREKTYLS